MNKNIRKGLLNKKVIRKENKPGEFTTVKYSLLHNTNLSPKARLLYISILSDSDRFRFSETTLQNRTGIKGKAYYSAIDELIEHGLLKKKKIKGSNFNYYIISEYGNLKTSDDSTESVQSEITDSKSVTKTVAKSIDKEKLEIYLNSIMSLLDNSKIYEGIALLIEETHSNQLTDYYEFKSLAEKIILKEKKKLYKEVYNNVKRKLESSPKRFQKNYNDYLKAEIFDNNNLSIVSDNKFAVKLAVYMRQYHYRPDPESIDADKRDSI